MMRIVLIVCAVAVGASPYCAHAQNTGNELLQNCQAALSMPGTPEGHSQMVEAERMKGMNCFGYVRGVWDTFSLYEAAGYPPLACIPQEATVGELVRVIVKYLNDHPNQLHEPDNVSLFKALKEAYPCKK
jgi:hypothetical protein